MTRPRVLILQAAGINCDVEMAHAFTLAGAQPEFVHIHALLADVKMLDAFKVFAVPGGFSYGDDISAGRILGLKLGQTLGEPLHRFVESGRLVVGICNGFQVLVKTELLPGKVGNAEGLPVTLAHNACGHFVDRWITVKQEIASQCVWTKGLGELELPIAHGEGRFVTADDHVLAGLERGGEGRLAVRKAGCRKSGRPVQPQRQPERHSRHL